jgi:predicted dehydrogenase
MSADILLVGCGNIGSRILQALARMRPEAIGGQARLAVVDIAPGTSDLVRRRLEESGAVDGSLATAGVSVTVHDRIPTMVRCDLGIVATTSVGRAAAIEAVLAAAAPRRLLLEKFLFQEAADYARAGALMAQSGTQAFVNTPRNHWPDYQALKRQLPTAGPINMRVTGANLALASNSIHFVELYAFLTGAPVSEFDGRGLLSGIKNKREGFLELSGTLTARGRDGGTLTLTSHSQAPRPQVIDLATEGGDFRVDETGGTLESWVAANKWSHTSQPFSEVYMSGLAEMFERLVTGATVSIPTYTGSTVHHLALMREFNLAFFGAEGVDRPCPIT